MTSLWLDRSSSIETDQFTPGADYEDVVVGAGLTGLTTAALLARAGRRVAVLEARHVGAVTTGNTTAKLSLLQGTTLSSITRHHSERVAAAYVDGNREAFAWVLRYCDDNQIPVAAPRRLHLRRIDLGRISGATRSSRLRSVSGWRSRGSTPRSCRIPRTARFGWPTRPSSIRWTCSRHWPPNCAAGTGVLVEGVRVVDVDIEDQASVRTNAGTVTAENVILATGVPILDRGLYFAKLTPQRSYALAFRVPGDIPQGMYLSADTPTRSLRTAPHGGEELLLVGGNGHTVGRHPKPPSELVADLTAWTEQHFPGAERTHVWSAQDYQSHNHVPFVGKMPRGRGHVYVATGYSKWGMTNSVAAALRLSAEILGGNMPWAETMGSRVSKPASALTTVQANLAVGAAATQGWVGAELHPLDEADLTPAEGEGIVGNLRGRPVAVATVDGRTCAVSAICTHLAACSGSTTWRSPGTARCTGRGLRRTERCSRVRPPRTSSGTTRR